jgi:hypothetical protein
LSGFCGCKTTIVDSTGRPEAVYQFGTMTATVNNNLDSVYNASQRALDKMELKTITSNKDALGAKITARDAMDKKVKVTLISLANNTTQVKISYGTVGDETKSKTIYRYIMGNM